MSPTCYPAPESTTMKTDPLWASTPKILTPESAMMWGGPRSYPCCGGIPQPPPPAATVRGALSTSETTGLLMSAAPKPVRFHVIRNARISNVGESQSCMVSKLRMMWKQGVVQANADRATGPGERSPASAMRASARGGTRSLTVPPALPAANGSSVI